ncbi:hypothetical protein YC2023_024316 [Brassica napus]
MVRKKTTPIYFAVNQWDPMVVQKVKPFKPYGTLVTEVLQMSGREPMQPATVEVQNRGNHSNPLISHETGIKVVIDKVDEMDKRLREVEAFVKEAKEKSASTWDGEPPLAEQDHVLEVPCANAEFGCPANVKCFAMQRHLLQCECNSTLDGRCVCSFIGTYRKLYAHTSSGHSDDLQMIECGKTSYRSCIHRYPSGDLNEVYSLLTSSYHKVTSMCPRSVDEVHPVWEHQDEDPVIDNLLEFLRQDNSLSTITWQPLPEYPLTPIECNKQTEEQVQSHDVLMSPRNLYQLLSEKVEVWEEQFNSVPVSAVFQSAGGITIDNLASRITQQEEIMLVITTAHDQFSNTKLPAKPATPAVLQGADGHHDQGKEVDKEDGKLVREDHPDNPEEENAVEDMEEELPFEVEGKDVGETALQTKREDHADNREKENPGEEAVEEQGNEESQPKSQGFCLSNCSLTSASKFFNVFLTKREWLDDEVGDLTFDTYLGVPRATSPYGDCGVYVLKFLECLMMGVELKSNFLNDGNMGLVRENLAAEMYVETASANANMWDPEFVTKAIDEAIPVE